MLLDSIFGERNFICNFIWEKTSNPNSTFNNVGIVHEYILCYSKSQVSLNKIPYSKEDIESYSGHDEYEKVRGPYKLVGLNKTGTLNDLRPNLTYFITAPDGTLISPKPRWRWSKEKFDRGLREGRIVFSKAKDHWSVSYKQYFLEDTEGNPVDRGSLVKSIITDCGRTTNGSNDLADIIGKGKFDFPKPIDLIKRILSISTKQDSLILDFYAGSGTTGQAVIELNRSDSGHRSFILCTNNENNICSSVTYPRLKTVITGKREDETKYGEPNCCNLYYLKTAFVKDQKNSDQAKYNLVEHLDPLLCIVEDTFNFIEKNHYSSHYQSAYKHLFIYNDFYNKKNFDEFKNRILKCDGDIVVYIFNSDNNIDNNMFERNNIIVKPIPSKIYEIYKEISDSIKRGE